MAYTAPTMYAGYVAGYLKGKRNLINRVTLTDGERLGKNKIVIWVAQRSGVQTLDGSFITGDEDNTSLTITASDYVIRTPYTPSAWNSVKADPNRILAQLKMSADDMYIKFVTDLEVVLTASTNTQALATDNTFTLGEFNTAVGKLMQYGVSLDDMTFISGPTGWASAVTDMQANAGGLLAGIEGNVGVLQGRIPAFVDANITISASTGGAAGYLFAKSAIHASIVDVNVIGPVDNPGTGSKDLVVTAACGFGNLEGAANPLVIKFTNP